MRPARHGACHALKTADRVRQIQSTVEHPLSIARRRNGDSRTYLPLAPASPLRDARAEAVEPVALEADRNRPKGSLAPETQPREFRPAHRFLQRRRRQHFEPIRIKSLDHGALDLHEIGDEVPELAHPCWLTRFRNLHRT